MSLTSDEEVEKYLNQLEKGIRAIKEDMMRVCWHMRGGISYEEASYLSPSEREIISKLIKENMDLTTKTRLPFI